MLMPRAGAGRLRRLMRGGTQSVRFAAPPDVAAMVRAASGLAARAPILPVHVLRWVMANTVEATQAGVLEFVEQVGGGRWMRAGGAAWPCKALQGVAAALGQRCQGQRQA